MPIQYENVRKPRKAGLVIGNVVINIKMPTVCIPALLPSGYVTLGKSFHLFEPQFPHL